MSTTRPSLAATDRKVSGKAVAALRRQGRLPAVVFGHGVPSHSVAVDVHEFEALRKRSGAHALIELSIDGGRPRTVLVHGVQVHPVTRRPLHVDLMVVRMTEEITVEVPIELVGESHAVDKLGGTLMHDLASVKVKALPTNLPQAIELSIEPIADFDTILHVRDLPVPRGVTILTDPDEPVAHVVAPRIEEVPAAAEAAEAGAPSAPAAPGETGAAAGGEPGSEQAG